MKVNIQKNNYRSSVIVFAFCLGLFQAVAYISVAVLAVVTLLQSGDFREKSLIVGTAFVLIFLSKIVGSNVSLIHVCFEESSDT